MSLEIAAHGHRAGWRRPAGRDGRWPSGGKQRLDDRNCPTWSACDVGRNIRSVSTGSRRLFEWRSMHVNQHLGLYLVAVLTVVLECLLGTESTVIWPGWWWGHSPCSSVVEGSSRGRADWWECGNWTRARRIDGVTMISGAEEKKYRSMAYRTWLPLRPFTRRRVLSQAAR